MPLPLLHPPPTILLLSLPPSCLIGIDLLTLTSSPRFKGLTFLPPGLRFIFAGASASLSSRTGFWIDVPHTDPASNSKESFLKAFEWSSETEELVEIEDEGEKEGWRRRLEGDGMGMELREGLVGYLQNVPSPAQAGRAVSGSSRPVGKVEEVGEEEEEEEGEDEMVAVARLASDGLVDEEVDERMRDGDVDKNADARATEGIVGSDWPTLTEHVTYGLLTRLTGSAGGEKGWVISTTSTGPQDQEEIPGLEGSWGGERQLGFAPIDLKRTWREGAVGRERTDGARDRSWALEDVVKRVEEGEGDRGGKEVGRERTVNEESMWGRDLLGEMQVCFLMILLLSNYSCLEQWKRIIGLVLTCRECIETKKGFFVEFLKVLRLQLRHCSDVEGGLFEIHDHGGGYLKSLLKSFKRTVDDVCSPADNLRHEIVDLEEWLGKEWGWEIGDSFLRKGMVQLEDGENVELEVDELEGEDERGEYAPIVVEEGAIG